MEGSRAERGSSSRRIFGCLTSARARATRCFCPPERVEGRRFERAVSWEARDLDGKRVAQGVFQAGAARLGLGRLPVGWYRIEGLDGSGKPVAWTTAAVLKRLSRRILI